MILDLLTYDPGLPCTDAFDYARCVVAAVEQHWDAGSDLVLLPEFLWMGLEPHVHESAGMTVLERIARCFWHDLLPELETRLARPGKAVVLGTCPHEAAGVIHNRAVIFANGRLLHQDKLHLTPWENKFTAGDRLLIWEFAGLRMAVIICLDIEIPELAARLRGQEVDLILCPSATETELGVERVDRCACARAVELGCYVGVAHLTGNACSDLVDKNVGRVAFYQPSQHVFRHAPRWIEGEVHESGSHTLRIPIDAEALKKMRRMKSETNPSQIGKKIAGLSRVIRLKCIR